MADLSAVPEGADAPEIEIPIVTDTRVGIADGKLVVERVADVEPILEHAKALHREGFHTTGMGDKHAASFDPLVVEKYCNDHGITFSEWCGNPEHVRAMLNDPDLKAFRVWPGRV